MALGVDIGGYVQNCARRGKFTQNPALSGTVGATPPSQCSKICTGARKFAGGAIAVSQNAAPFLAMVEEVLFC